MSDSSSLVLFRPKPSASLKLSSSPASLISSRLFSQQTGTAIATELLYRILYDILNRCLISLQHLASRSIEECSSFIERKISERRERLAAAKAAGNLGIVEEVSKMAQDSGFVTCPMTGRQMDGRMGGRMGPPGPPMWVRAVLEGIEEGRIHDKDFWLQTHGD